MLMRQNNTVCRISQYRNALQRFRQLGFLKIFSSSLADAIGVAATLVRKDFSILGINGRKRGGYDITELLSHLDRILYKEEIQDVLLVGVGNLGSALLKYGRFLNEGVRILAAFDVDRAKHNDRGRIPVYPLETMLPFIEEHNLKLGILAVPEMVAQEVADQMVVAGIVGILNFAPIQLRAVPSCIVRNVNLEHEIDMLVYSVINSGLLGTVAAAEGECANHDIGSERLEEIAAAV